MLYSYFTGQLIIDRGLYIRIYLHHYVVLYVIVSLSVYTHTHTQRVFVWSTLVTQNLVLGASSFPCNTCVTSCANFGKKRPCWLHSIWCLSPCTGLLHEGKKLGRPGQVPGRSRKSGVDLNHHGRSLFH
jgi:hypothetical protein